MPGTTTSRLQLYKPADIGEVVDVDTSLNDNYDKIDAAVGAKPVTSGSRPPAPYDGQVIRETDTGAIGFWNDSEDRWEIFDTRWQSYTPKVYVGGTELGTGGSTLGNAVIGARQFRTGKMARVRGGFQVGTTTLYGPLSGAISIALPAPGVNHAGNGWVGSVDAPQGMFKAAAAALTYDGSVGYQSGILDRFHFVVLGAGNLSGGGFLTTAYNVTLGTGTLTAAGHFFNYDATYQVA